MKKWCLPGDPPLRTPRLWRVPSTSAHSAQWQWSSSRSSVQKSRKRGKLCLHCNTSYTGIVGLITLHTLHSDKIVTIIIAEVEKQISIWGQVNFSKSLLTLTDFFTNQYCVIVNSLLCLIVCKRSVMLSTNAMWYSQFGSGSFKSRAQERLFVHGARLAHCRLCKWPGDSQQGQLAWSDRLMLVFNALYWQPMQWS